MLAKLLGVLVDNRWWRGLVSRLTLLYAVVSLLLSAGIAYSTLTIARDRLGSNFEETAIRQLEENAAEVRLGLQGLPEANDPETAGEILNSIDSKLTHTDASDSLLVLEGIGARLTNRSEAEIPAELSAKLNTVDAAGMYYSFGNEPRFIAGVRMTNSNPDGGADYYEIHSLVELEGTLEDLRQILIGAAIVSSVLGAAIGYYAAKRSLAPIRRISTASKDIADGNFQTRLDMQSDPDLAILSSSFNGMVDELKAKIERDQRFTSDVSHELRSPLMTLRASVDLLERKESELPETLQQAIQLIGQDVHRFEQLVEDLLEISRMDAGAVQLQVSNINLLEFLSQVVKQSPTPDIEVVALDSSETVIIAADKRRLAQVFSNLISNAAKYGGGAQRITYRQISSTVQITVEDEGPGVPPKERQQIFERFSRGAADAGNRQSGTGVGLGLSLVKEHLNLHGGNVWVTDRYDSKPGARFVVELPVGDIDELEGELAV